MPLDLVWRLVQEVFGLGPFCLLKVMRRALGLAYGDPRFTAIVSPYWEHGHGTTCAVVLGWALEQCNWPGPLNRGKNWDPPRTIGKHDGPIFDYARSRGAVENDPDIRTLLPGDIIYLLGDKPTDWHVGIVEQNLFPAKLVTLDGGQSDKRGEQSIARVERPIDPQTQKVGPYNFRKVKLVIRTRRIM